MAAGEALGVPRNRDFNGAGQEGVGPYHLTIHQGRRMSASRAWLWPARNRPNLRIETGALATRILFEGAEVDVPDAGRARLTEIARAVQDGNDRIQVRAYADSETETSDWKRRVSLRRAQTVRRVLLDNGVEPADEGPGNRVDVEIASR
jgi:choline dehydrogenase-like flavoprotein